MSNSASNAKKVIQNIKRAESIGLSLAQSYPAISASQVLGKSNRAVFLNIVEGFLKLLETLENELILCSLISQSDLPISPVWYFLRIDLIYSRKSGFSSVNLFAVSQSISVRSFAGIIIWLSEGFSTSSRIKPMP